MPDGWDYSAQDFPPPIRVNYNVTFIIQQHHAQKANKKSILMAAPQSTPTEMAILSIVMSKNIIMDRKDQLGRLYNEPLGDLF